MSDRENREQQQGPGPYGEPGSTAPTPSFSPEDMMKHMATACGCSPAMNEMAAACCGKPEGSKASASQE